MNKLLLIIFLLAGNFSKGQNHAIIEFAGEKNNYSRTYLGKVKKGNSRKLNNYLQHARVEEATRAITAPQPDPNPKKREKMRQVTKAYDVNEKELARKNKRQLKKYQEEKENYYREAQKSKKKKQKQFDAKAFKQSLKTNKSKLAKEYKIKGRRLRTGKKLKYKAGNVTMILKYEVKKDGSIKTYVTSLNSQVKAGAKYWLKYYGNDGRRQYYLEKIPNAN